MSALEEQPEGLISEQKIDLPYTYTAGAMHRAALNGLAEGRLVGSSNGSFTAVPTKPFGPDGAHLTEPVDLPDRGVLEARTVAHHLDGAPAFGLIRIEGADNLMVHRLGDGAEQLEPGAAVQAVWSDEPGGSILDITHFGPA